MLYPQSCSWPFWWPEKGHSLAFITFWSCFALSVSTYCKVCVIRKISYLAFIQCQLHQCFCLLDMKKKKMQAHLNTRRDTKLTFSLLHPARVQHPGLHCGDLSMYISLTIKFPNFIHTRELWFRNSTSIRPYCKYNMAQRADQYSAEPATTMQSARKSLFLALNNYGSLISSF